MQYRTDTKRVKGLGTAKHGFGHWWMQRLTAVLMIPLGIWFVYSLLSLKNLAPDTIILWLYNPIPALLMALWTIVAVYHATLGVQVIIEDYVQSKKLALSLLVSIKFAMFIMIVVTFFSLFKLVS
ncbi:Succinate dehydrogenase hydrophobic membrane anchor protein [hydrothermal vent metagenome]|uniref:Succinate dehydrogenase hydrophobic membrane anchor protein n=1 Tax=hydrothermal vent metagenome TaxID=652676 RepID=A0A3B0UYI9_9ZZZZ